MVKLKMISLSFWFWEGNNFFNKPAVQEDYLFIRQLAHFLQIKAVYFEICLEIGSQGVGRERFSNKRGSKQMRFC